MWYSTMLVCIWDRLWYIYIHAYITNYLVYMQVNHFPGTFQIGRKDRLWRNLFRLQARVGKKHCDFVPQTYVVPQDLLLLKRDWEEGSKQKWILKPVRNYLSIECDNLYISAFTLAGLLVKKYQDYLFVHIFESAFIT